MRRDQNWHRPAYNNNRAVLLVQQTSLAAFLPLTFLCQTLLDQLCVAPDDDVAPSRRSTRRRGVWGSRSLASSSSPPLRGRLRLPSAKHLALDTFMRSTVTAPTCFPRLRERP